MRVLFISALISFFAFQAQAQKMEDEMFRQDLMEIENEIIEAGEDGEAIVLINRERELRGQMEKAFSGINMEFALKVPKESRTKLRGNPAILEQFKVYKKALNKKLNYLNNLEATKQLVKDAYPDFIAN